MGKILTLPIIYNNNGYYLLVRTNPVKDKRFRFHISLVAENVHSKIYDRYIFEGNAEGVSLVPGEGGTPPDELENTISSALKNYLRTASN